MVFSYSIFYCYFEIKFENFNSIKLADGDRFFCRSYLLVYKLQFCFLVSNSGPSFHFFYFLWDSLLADLHKNKMAVSRIILISSIWISVEFLRHRTFLAFPWGVMGYSQHNYLPLMQISKLTGVLGVSLLIVLFNLCLAEIIIHFTCKRAFKFQVLFSFIAIVVLVASNALFGSIYFKAKDKKYTGEKLDVAVVQPNISFDDKFETGTAVLIPDKSGSGDKYFSEGTDLVVYPESVIWGDMELERNKELRDWVKNTAQKKIYIFLWVRYCGMKIKNTSILFSFIVLI